MGTANASVRMNFFENRRQCVRNHTETQTVQKLPILLNASFINQTITSILSSDYVGWRRWFEDCTARKNALRNRDKKSRHLNSASAGTSLNYYKKLKYSLASTNFKTLLWQQQLRNRQISDGVVGSRPTTTNNNLGLAQDQPTVPINKQFRSKVTELQAVVKTQIPNAQTLHWHYHRLYWSFSRVSWLCAWNSVHSIDAHNDNFTPLSASA